MFWSFAMTNFFLAYKLTFKFPNLNYNKQWKASAYLRVLKNLVLPSRHNVLFVKTCRTQKLLFMIDHTFVFFRLIMCDCVCRVRARLLESCLLTSWRGRHGFLEQILMMKIMRNLRRCWSRHRAHRSEDFISESHVIFWTHVSKLTVNLHTDISSLGAPVDVQSSTNYFLLVVMPLWSWQWCPPTWCSRYCILLVGGVPVSYSHESPLLWFTYAGHMISWKGSPLTSSKPFEQRVTQSQSFPLIIAS